MVEGSRRRAFGVVDESVAEGREPKGKGDDRRVGGTMG
jgi:hypothetical protein